MTTTRVPLDFHDLQLAMAMVDSPSAGEVTAYVCRKTGRVLMDTSDINGENDLPDDVDDATRYVPIPVKRELDLGNRLAFDFTAQRMGDAYDQVRAIFSRRGAWARFKDLLDRRGLLNEWYAYQAAAEIAALREWAQENGFELVGAGVSGPPAAKTS